MPSYEQIIQRRKRKSERLAREAETKRAKMIKVTVSLFSIKESRGSGNIYEQTMVELVSLSCHGAYF